MSKWTFRGTAFGVSAAIVIALAAGSIDAPSWAKGGGGHGGGHGGGFAGAHSRRAEVGGRDRNLARQMNGHYGHLGGHYRQLQHEDSGIRRQENRWSKQNGGHLTQGEQNRLNHEENGLRNQLHADEKLGVPQKSQFAINHPRRAEVLNRDSRIGGTLNADAGKLHGNFGSLKQDQRSIHQQEQSDAAGNGGHITKAEQQQLNGEENSLNGQIKQDLSH